MGNQDLEAGGFLADLPAADEPTFAMFVPCRRPCQLQASRHHPLARETGLTPEDRLRFPGLALPEG